MEVIFPIRGHSRLPPDKIFGRVEQDLRKTADINLPEDYNKIYSKDGCVRKLNQNWPVRDFKQYAAYMRDFPGIQHIKQVQLTRCKDKVVFKLEMNYFSSDKNKKFVDIMKSQTTEKIRTLPLSLVLQNVIPLQLLQNQTSPISWMLGSAIIIQRTRVCSSM